MQVLGFSPRVHEEIRRLLNEERPVISFKVTRDADMASKPVPLIACVCEGCGWEMKSGKLFIETLAQNMSNLGEELPRGSLPSDVFEVIEVTHAYDQASRSVYCGGRIRFVTPAAA